MTTNPIVLNSSNPLPNLMLNFKKLYFVCAGIIALGALLPPLLIVGILALIGVYAIDEVKTSAQRNKLRGLKFQYDNTFSQNELFEKLQTALISKYGEKMLLERDSDGKIMISFDDHIYDIHFNDDNTFSIWWRKSLGKAVFSISEYKSYKKILIAYGIIGYEIQRNVNLTV